MTYADVLDLAAYPRFKEGAEVWAGRWAVKMETEVGVARVFTDRQAALEFAREEKQS